MAILGKFEEKQMTDKEYIEHEARERARAIRRGDAGHGYRCRAMFTTDDVGKWRNEDYCLYVQCVEKVANEMGIEYTEELEVEGV